MNFSKQYKQLKFYSWLTQTALFDPKGIFVISYPRSGSSWLSRMLKSAMDIHKRSTNKSLHFESNVVHTHRFYFSNIAKSRKIYIVRDFRDVVISYANALKRAVELGKMTEQEFRNLYSIETSCLDPNSTEFILFLEFILNTRIASIPWNDHLNYAFDLGLKIIRYEDLRTDNKSIMNNLLENLIPEHQINVDEIISSHSILVESKTSRLKFNARQGNIAKWVEYKDLEWVHRATEYAHVNLARLNYSSK